MLLNYKSIDNFYSAADFVYIFKYMYNCITKSMLCINQNYKFKSCVIN